MLITVFLFGGTTELALDALDIDMNVDEEEYMKRESKNFKFGLLDAFGESIFLVSSCPLVVSFRKRAAESIFQ